MIYFEIGQEYAARQFDGVRYWVSNSGSNAIRYLQASKRAWREEGDIVRFVKHRDTGIMTPVDMREFFLVKLRSKQVPTEYKA